MFAALFAFAALTIPCARGAESSRGQVWIAIRSDESPGSGTQADPFDGSGQEKFDAVMNRVPPGTHIHLGPGVFDTRGVHVKESWHVQGAGKARTTIRLADGVAAEHGSSTTVLFNRDWEGFYKTVQISDLTVDCNRAAQPVFAEGRAGALNAITVASRQTRIARVRALGTWADPGEGFPFSVLSSGSTDGSNRIEIDECENLNSAGSLTAISAFDQTGGRLSGYIRNCLATDNPNAAGFGSGGWKNFALVGNRTRDLGAAVVIDTHDYENVRIEANHFHARRYGILFNGRGQYKNIIIARNRFEMSPTAEACLWTNEANVSTQIRLNTILQESPTAPAFLIGANTTGAIENNVVRETIGSTFWRSPKLHVRNNRTPSGSTLRFPRFARPAPTPPP